MSVPIYSNIRTPKPGQDVARMGATHLRRMEDTICPIAEQNVDGRAFHPNTTMSEKHGCYTPVNRIMIENGHRPQYAEYITHNVSGITGIDSQTARNTKYVSSEMARQNLDEHGSFGSTLGNTIRRGADSSTHYTRFNGLW